MHFSYPLEISISIDSFQRSFFLSLENRQFTALFLINLVFFFRTRSLSACQSLSNRDKGFSFGFFDCTKYRFENSEILMRQWKWNLILSTCCHPFQLSSSTFPVLRDLISPFNSVLTWWLTTCWRIFPIEQCLLTNSRDKKENSLSCDFLAVLTHSFIYSDLLSWFRYSFSHFLTLFFLSIRCHGDGIHHFLAPAIFYCIIKLLHDTDDDSREAISSLHLS